MQGAVMNNCRICGRWLATNDALPFLDGKAHMFCAAKATLTGRIGSKILVMVRRKGFAAKAVRP
jgi:hypothetical protein